jgi:MFS family permease
MAKGSAPRIAKEMPIESGRQAEAWPVLAAIAKPLIGLSTGWQGVLGARFLDRLGTGTRSAPRDALIASSADEEHRGKAFGLEGVGDNLGAFLGPLLSPFKSRHTCHSRTADGRQ